MDCREPRTPEELESYYRLRWRILREPWGQPQGSERDEHESDAVHACVFDTDGNAIGAGRLHDIGGGTARIRYMAVDAAYRKQGIGRHILAYLEKEAQRTGFTKIVLNARESSIAFYEYCGYTVTGPSHTLFDEIPHVVMEKYLPVA